MSVTVVIVDDHPVVRTGLTALLGNTADLDVIAGAGSGADGLDLVERLHPQVVLTDLRMGTGMDGVELTEKLRALPEPPAVIILTTYDHDHDIVRAIEAGAAGYLLKDADPDAIVRAVVDAAAGLDVLDPGLARRVARSMRARPELSEREVDVLALVADGLSNKEIARRLFISEATVKSHLVHTFTKLDVASRTAAAAKARELGLIR